MTLILAEVGVGFLHPDKTNTRATRVKIRMASLVPSIFKKVTENPGIELLFKPSFPYS
jgi:hypothetical protein